MPCISSFKFMMVFLECSWDFTTFFSLLLISSTGGRALAALLKWRKRSVCSIKVWWAKQEHVSNAPMLTCRNVSSSLTTTIKIVVSWQSKISEKDFVWEHLSCCTQGEVGCSWLPGGALLVGKTQGWTCFFSCWFFLTLQTTQWARCNAPLGPRWN